MSYGFELYYTPADIDPKTAHDKYVQERREKLTGRSSFRDTLGPIDPHKEELKRSAAKALIALHPQLSQFHWNYEKIAKSKSIDESEARRRFRETQLTDGFGLEITLFDETAALTIPFGPNAEDMLSRAWECFRLLESMNHYSVFDSQVGKVLDLTRDFELVLNALKGMNQRLDRDLRRRD